MVSQQIKIKSNLKAFTLDPCLVGGLPFSVHDMIVIYEVSENHYIILILQQPDQIYVIAVFCLRKCICASFLFYILAVTFISEF